MAKKSILQRLSGVLQTIEFHSYVSVARNRAVFGRAASRLTRVIVLMADRLLLAVVVRTVAPERNVLLEFSLLTRLSRARGRRPPRASESRLQAACRRCPERARGPHPAAR